MVNSSREFYLSGVQTSYTLCDTKTHWLINSKRVELSYSQTKSDVSTTSFKLSTRGGGKVKSFDFQFRVRVRSSSSTRCETLYSLFKLTLQSRVHKQLVKENLNMYCDWLQESDQTKRQVQFISPNLDFGTKLAP